MAKQYDERLLKLRQEIRNVIADSGLKTYPFHAKYGFNADGKQDISASAFAGYANNPKSFPDTATFDALSKILSRGAGRKVTASYLMGLCDLAQPEYDGIEGNGKNDGIVDTSSIRADILIKQFEALPYVERCRIAPDLLRSIADNNEYNSLDLDGQVAWLVERERKRQGMGAEKLANEFVKLPCEIIKSIIAKEKTRLTKNQLIVLAGRIHNIDGDLLEEWEEVKRSIFAQVLSPQLFSED